MGTKIRKNKQKSLKKHEKDEKNAENERKWKENHENRINVRSQIKANSHNSRKSPWLVTQKASYFTIKTDPIDESRRTMYHQRCCF